MEISGQDAHIIHRFLKNVQLENYQALDNTERELLSKKLLPEVSKILSNKDLENRYEIGLDKSAFESLIKKLSKPKPEVVKSASPISKFFQNLFGRVTSEDLLKQVKQIKTHENLSSQIKQRQQVIDANMLKKQELSKKNAPLMIKKKAIEQARGFFKSLDSRFIDSMKSAMTSRTVYDIFRGDKKDEEKKVADLAVFREKLLKNNPNIDKDTLAFIDEHSQYFVQPYGSRSNDSKDASMVIIDNELQRLSTLINDNNKEIKDADKMIENKLKEKQVILKEFNVKPKVSIDKQKKEYNKIRKEIAEFNEKQLQIVNINIFLKGYKKSLVYSQKSTKDYISENKNDSIFGPIIKSINQEILNKDRKDFDDIIFKNEQELEELDEIIKELETYSNKLEASIKAAAESKSDITPKFIQEVAPKFLESITKDIEEARNDVKELKQKANPNEAELKAANDKLQNLESEKARFEALQGPQGQ